MSGYRVKTVATITGIPRNTLLAWERRYNVVTPERSANGYRVYSDADVAKLRQLKALVDEGHVVSQAVGLLARPPSPSPPVPTTSPLDQTRGAVLTALLQYDRAEADTLTDALEGVDYVRLLDGFYFPMMCEVGDGWASGKLTIAQEHFVSTFCRDRLVSMLLRLGCGPTNGPRAACACFPEEQHELALLGVSIRLALQGWRVTHLGARLPLDALLHFVDSHPPELLCISVVHEVDEQTLGDYLRELRDQTPDSIRIALGGPWVKNVDPIQGVQLCSTFADLRLR